MSVVLTLTSPALPASPTPRLSVVVIGYRMAEQLLNTVYTLSVTH